MSTHLVWQRTTLPNGLTVLLYPRHSANTSQLSITVKSGSNQEPPKAAGITHFLEHMLAGGSTQRIRLSRSIEDTGGVLDFYTDHEQVTSTLDVLPQHLLKALSILSSLLFDGNFDAEKFEVERKIILNELAEFADNPSIRVEELLLENLFKKHSVKRPVGGYPKTVKKLTLEQLHREHQNNYTPKNMIVVLAGNYEEKTKTQIISNLARKDCTANPKGAKRMLEIGKPKSRVETEKGGITQTYIYIGARTVNSGHPDSVALDIIATTLGGGTTSRLFESLREKHGITYDVGAVHCKGSDYGYLGINCALNHKKVQKATDLITQEIKNLQTAPVSMEELDRAKQVILGGVLRGMDNPNDRLEILNYMEMQFGSPNALEDYVNRITAATGRDVCQAANQYLDSDSLCTALLTPARNGQKNTVK